jgi:tetratricopeptide (TPR) repeat protein
MARYLERNVELQESMVSAFHRAGVPLMCGTDAPFDLVVPGASLHDELAAFVACGMTPLEALRAATLVPARFLGIDAESGSVAAGKRADLVLVEGDPLEDVGAARRIGGVCLAGRWLPREQVDERLAALAARNAAAEQRVDAITARLDADRLEDALSELGPPAERDPRVAAWLEQRLNARGYELLAAKRVDEALSVFRLNTRAFPNAFNTWDSLGEACMEKGAYEEAIRHYERSLELNPANENGRRMIERIAEKDEGASKTAGEPH